MHNQDEKRLDNKSIEKRKKKKIGDVMGIAGETNFACPRKRLLSWVGTEKLALQPATYKNHSEELVIIFLHACVTFPTHGAYV